ncbi:MAG: alpha/beta fold hydrolase [Arenicella sp.]
MKNSNSDCNDHHRANGTAYRLTGLRDAPTVVLIHGLGLNQNVWDEYVAVFEKQYRVLSYDLLGHGNSVMPESEPSLTVYALQLRQLMDELDIETAVLIGFSLGGMINRRFAMDNPERVSALGILNSPHERSPEAQKLVEQRVADTGAGGLGATLSATLERWFTPEFLDSNKEYVQQVADWVLANDPVGYTQCRQVLAVGVTELIRPEPPVKPPTIVITCENDSGSTPAMSLAIASEIDGAETVILPRLQHMGLVEQPELFIEPLLTFLKAKKL